MTNVLITGCSRGIGLSLVRQFLKQVNTPKLLIATCRNPETAIELRELANAHSNLKILKLDVNDIESYETFVKTIDGILGAAGLNLLIHNAGIGKMVPREQLTWQDYRDMIHTNCIAPVFLTQALLPLIEKASAANNNLPKGIAKAAIVNISSILGSLSLNDGGFWGYRESKSALNQAFRTFALELQPKGILVCSLHPGWVRTDMGGPDALLDVEDSTAGLIKIIYNLNEADHDGFYDYTGKTLTW